MNIYQVSLNALYDLKANRISSPHAGICYNLVSRLSSHSDVAVLEQFLREAFEEILGFEPCERERDFPIEGSEEAYCSNENKWDTRTEFGKKRMKYVEKLIPIVERKMKELEHGITL